MRTRNPNVEKARDTTLGRTHARRASRGQLHTDSDGGEVIAPTTQYIGATVDGEDGETAYITINGAGQNATNDSGITLVYGDVVVLDTDGTIITTTTAQDTRPVGVVQVGGANGDDVAVVFSGYVAQVNTTASVTAGYYAETSTTAGDATASATRRTGSFGIVLATQQNPPALLFGIPDSSPAIVSGDYVLSYNGGEERVNSIGNLGSTEAINLANGNWQRGTLNANCTFTFTGATNGKGCSFTLFLAEDGTGGWSPTWPGSVVWIGGTTPTHDTTASTTSIYVFLSYDGGTTWYGAQSGGGSSSSGEILISDTPSTPLVFADLIQNEAENDLVYAD